MAMALSLSLGACSTASQPFPASKRLKVASWNLEHLAERDGEGCRPRTEADYAALRDHVQTLDADVVAFQEVESRKAAERVFTPDRYDVVFSSRPPSQRGGACYGASGQTIRNQAVGFAIRKGVPWTRNPDLSALGLGNPDLRWGVDITVNTAEPLRLLAVHLKSGCNSGRSETDPDCPVLFAQLPVLETWVDTRATEGQAFVVLGDWNRRLEAREDSFYADLNDGDPAEASLTLASNGRSAGCKARFREFIDHIALGARAASRQVPGSFEEYTYGVPEDAHPSDHCPVSVRIH